MKLLMFLFSFLSIINHTNAQTLRSPDGHFEMTFSLSENGTPAYQLSYKSKKIIQESSLGISTKKNELSKGFTLVKNVESTFNESWKPVLGEYESIQNHYNELLVELKNNNTEELFNIRFKLYNQGLGLRYEIPKQTKINYFEITEENTQFRLTGDHKAFWIPGDYDSQEYYYNENLLSEIDLSKLDLNNGVGLKSIKERFLVQSPLQMKTQNGLYINIFEAALDNYPVMHLQLDVKNYLLSSYLAPNTVGSKAFLQAPWNSPWRTIIASDKATEIVAANTMILNLNEPNRIQDVSFIKPMKYVGIWWEMHVGASTWDYAGLQDAHSAQNLKPTGKHGATTENTKRYIDFAAKHGFDGVLVEGWNAGWEDWYGNWKEDVFDFITPYPDYNLSDIQKYAQSKGVKMIMHHETSGSIANYERHLDRAINLMKKYNYPAVKTGYVGKIIPRGEYHDGQQMVKHFNYVARRMAENKLMLNSHESSRPTGIHRTYPNYIAAEAARGNEFNAWSVGNPPNHETILPFTRLMGGPMDYTPGIFEIKMDVYKPGAPYQVHTTLAKQLALYVTLYSPLQMAADLLQNYEKYMDAFQFIKDVPVDWSDSKYLMAEPGDYLVVARRDKRSNNWFIGGITDENERDFTIDLSFLPAGKYEATLYLDGQDADWQKKPKSYQIRKEKVNEKSSLTVHLAKSGGCAIALKKI